MKFIEGARMTNTQAHNNTTSKKQNTLSTKNYSLNDSSSLSVITCGQQIVQQMIFIIWNKVLKNCCSEDD